MVAEDRPLQAVLILLACIIKMSRLKPYHQLSLLANFRQLFL